MQRSHKNYPEAVICTGTQFRHCRIGIRNVKSNPKESEALARRATLPLSNTLAPRKPAVVALGFPFGGGIYN